MLRCTGSGYVRKKKSLLIPTSSPTSQAGFYVNFTPLLNFSGFASITVMWLYSSHYVQLSAVKMSSSSFPLMLWCRWHECWISTFLPMIHENDRFLSIDETIDTAAAAHQFSSAWTPEIVVSLFSDQSCVTGCCSHIWSPSTHNNQS